MKLVITTVALLLLGFTAFSVYTKNETLTKAISKKQDDDSWSKVTNDMCKHLQGPADEFDEHKLPLPKDNGVSSDSATFSIRFTKVESERKNLHQYEYRGHLAVDTKSKLTVSLISVHTGLRLFVLKPGEKELVEITQDTPNVFVVAENLSWGTEPLPTVTYSFEGDSLVRGLWTIMVKTHQRRELPVTGKDHASILIDNVSPLQIETHLSSYNQRVGENIGLVTKIIIEETEKTRAFGKINEMPRVKSITAVDMAVTTPQGEVSYVNMKDDGKNMDGLAGDRVYGANIVAQEAGTYLSQVQFSGEMDDGTRFIRTSQHIFSVVRESLILKNQATYTLNQDLMKISWSVSEKDNLPIIGKKYKVYAEVWGQNIFRRPVAIAWIGGMSIVDEKSTLPLELNLKWISKTKNKFRWYELRNVYIQEPSYNIPLAQVASIKLTSLLKQDMVAHIRSTKSAQYTGVTTEDMLVGHRPERYMRKNKKKGDGKLILSHGYCSSSVPFRSSDFTNFALFLDPNANRAHDEFALRIKIFGEQFGEGFSLVAHSQGGMASLHLLSFYWSNQDLLVDFTKVGDNRVVQSVGSPYMGNSMAGTIAGIGAGIGFGCGANSNMERNGALLWIATIPKAARKQVHFFKTQYQRRSWCQFAAQAVLKWPNDGTTEVEWAVLADATHEGLKYGWCHVSGMKFENQCLDSENNRKMNEKAAR